MEVACGPAHGGKGGAQAGGALQQRLQPQQNAQTLRCRLEHRMCRFACMAVALSRRLFRRNKDSQWTHSEALEEGSPIHGRPPLHLPHWVHIHRNSSMRLVNAASLHAEWGSGQMFAVLQTNGRIGVVCDRTNIWPTPISHASC